MINAAPVNDGLPFSPAADRNKGPWLAVLASLLPPAARVLEIASGTGQHAAHCGAAQPAWQWQPSEREAAALPAIAARCAGLPNVATPVQIDVLALPWAATPPGARFDALVAMNLLHIAPWSVCAALMQGAAQHVVVGGLLIVYGPFIVDGLATAAGNLSFDADLRARDPLWGLRRQDDVMRAARAVGLQHEQSMAMPANNLSLVFRLSR